MRDEYKSDWSKINGSMSDKSAIEEFGLTSSEIVDGIQSGLIQYRKNNVHGNPYLKLLRREVEAFVTQKYGEDYTNQKVNEKQLKEVVKELNSMKRKVASLEKTKAKLMKNTSVVTD